MDAFKSRMALAGASNPMRCRVFPITLKKAALKWFNSLPSKSISKFSDLQSHFLAHFTSRRFKLTPVTSLLDLSQWQVELRWDFLEQFNAETLLEEEVETQAAVLTLLNRLRLGAFKDSLSKRPAKTMNKIQVRAERYIYLKETQRATTNFGKKSSRKEDGLTIRGSTEEGI